MLTAGKGGERLFLFPFKWGRVDPPRATCELQYVRNDGKKGTDRR